MTATTEPIRFRTSEEFKSRPRWTDGLNHQSHKLIRIIGDYDLPKAEQLSCGLADCRTPHQRGYVVETADGLETHIGNQCGWRHFHMQWGELNAQFRRAAEDRDRRQWLDSLLSAKEPMLRRIDDLLRRYSEVVGALCQHLERINKEPAVVRALEGALNESGAIQVIREVDAKVAEAMGLSNAQRRQIETVGRLMGYESIKVDHRKGVSDSRLTIADEDLFRRLKVKVRAGYQGLSVSSLQGLNHRQRKKLAEELEQHESSVRGAEKALANLEAFSSQRNLCLLGKLEVPRPNDRTLRLLRHYAGLGEAGATLPTSPP